MNDMVAAASKILTKRSSNYSFILSQMLSFSHFASSFGPYFSNLFYASAALNPTFGSTSNSLSTSVASFL